MVDWVGKTIFVRKNGYCSDLYFQKKVFDAESQWFFIDNYNFRTYITKQNITPIKNYEDLLLQILTHSLVPCPRSKYSDIRHEFNIEKIKDYFPNE